MAPDWLPLNLSILFAVRYSAPTHRIVANLLPLDPDGAAGEGKGQQHFLNQGVGQTRGRTGILVLISQLERRVEVVATGDTRGPDRWQALLENIQAGYEGQDLVGTGAGGQSVGEFSG